jgi:exodeoxyribonuclease VII large subunit
VSQDAFDFDLSDGAAVEDSGAAADGSDEAATLSIGELVSRVNRTLADGVGRGIWVRGEINSFTQRTQHRYFTLVDDGAGAADVRQRPKVAAALFGQTFQRLRRRLEEAGLTLQDGVAVRVRGTLELYGPTGRLTFRVSDIDPQFTLGHLALQRDALLRRLAADGLLELNRSLDLPLVPSRVGVVTSRQSDGWHDFRTNLSESGLGFDLLLAPVVVQGASAPIQIGRALHLLGARGDVDVIVLVRGGGSRSDLATFDHERVAKAIANCPLPVITGVGHDLDRSVADHVAHTATKTPTACAQFLIDRVRSFTSDLDRCSHAVAHAANRTLSAAGAVLARDRHRVRVAARRSIRDAHDHVQRTGRDVSMAARGTLDGGAHELHQSERRLEFSARRAVRSAETRLEQVATRFARRPAEVLRQETHRLDVLEARLRAVDPEHALERGWTITTTPDGRIVRSIHELQPGDTVTTRLRDGQAHSTVTQVEGQT